MHISITTTEAEALALSYKHTDFDFYLSSVAQGQVNLAVDEIAKITVEQCIATGTPIPNSKDEMVALAFVQGWVKSAADRMAEMPQTLGAPK